MTSVIERIDTQTPSPTDELITRLRAAVPEYFTEGELDTDRLLATLGHIPDGKSDRYSFTWAGKRDAIRALQTPSSGTLVPVLEESVNWETTRHLFIEGDNLEVLKLLYKAYFGKVKLIYIDPPYNTGNDFVYPDDFADPLGRYLEITGQKDAEGNWATSNPEKSGRYHSAWLSMMYPRLFLARQLLAEDGVIFISIDDTEIHNLRLIMNEIFGEENFVATVIWEKKFSPQNDARWLSDNHDYILVYARSKETWRPRLLPRTEEADARYGNPDNDPRGPWSSSDVSVRTYSAQYDYEIETPSGRRIKPPEGRCWGVPKQRFHELVADNRIWFGPDGKNAPRLKRFLSEVKQGLTPLTLWKRDDVGDNQEARREIRTLFGDVGIFDTPKPISLLQRIIHLATEPLEGDLILDFFAGSGSLGHAVMSLNQQDGGNRSFILVQLPERTGFPTMPTIADVGKERLRRAVGVLQDEPHLPQAKQQQDGNLGFKVFKLAESAFPQWKGTPESALEHYVEQLRLMLEERREGIADVDVLYELALKTQGYGLHLVIQEVKECQHNRIFRVADPSLGEHFYVCLDSRINTDFQCIADLAPETTLVCRDSALTDTVAANLALHCRLRTI